MKRETSDLVDTPCKLKYAVKSAIKEKDRSRSLIVFGLQDEGNEQVEEEILKTVRWFGRETSFRIAGSGEVCWEYCLSSSAG